MEIVEGKFLATPEKGEVSSLTYLPPNPQALLVLGHGAGAGMRHANLENIANGLAQHQIGTFRYQFPYMERGGGRDSQKVSLATVVEAVNTAKSQYPGLPLFAGGHSFGGRMTSLAAGEHLLDGLQGLVFFAFPLHAPGKPGIERAAHLDEIREPMLFLSGTRDTFLQLDLFRPIIEKLNSRATLHLLDTANHGYKILKRTRSSEEGIFEEISRVAGNWMRAQLGE